MHPAPLFGPSGDDANPFNQRLPAEVVSRRARPQPRKNEPEKNDEVQVDLQTAISLKPEKRLLWLTKACKMAVEGKAPCGELFNIITTRRFATGVPVKIGKKLREGVLEHVNLFSEKQQRHLRSDEWALSMYFDKADAEPTADADDDVDNENAEPEDVHDEPRSDGPRTSVLSVLGERENRSSKPRDGGARRPIVASQGQEIERLPVAPGSFGGWVSVAQTNGDRQHRHALLAMERRKNRDREKEDKLGTPAEVDTKQQEQQQQQKRRQVEEDVDSSLQMLESLTQVRQHSPRRSSGGKRRDGRKGLSRSRSISVHRSPSRSRDKRSKVSRVSFEQALRERMDARDKADTTRNPVSHWRSQG